MRQAYDYWQDQPGSCRTRREPCPEGRGALGGTTARARVVFLASLRRLPAGLSRGLSEASPTAAAEQKGAARVRGPFPRRRQHRSPHEGRHAGARGNLISRPRSRPQAGARRDTLGCLAPRGCEQGTNKIPLRRAYLGQVSHPRASLLLAAKRPLAGPRRGFRKRNFRSWVGGPARLGNWPRHTRRSCHSSGYSAPT